MSCSVFSVSTSRTKASRKSSPSPSSSFSYLRTASLKHGQIRGSWRGRRGEPRLDEHFLHARLPLVELVVDLVEVLDAHAMRNHPKWIDLARLDHLEELLPVKVDWRLPVADKADTAVHQAADIEVVGLGGGWLV